MSVRICKEFNRKKDRTIDDINAALEFYTKSAENGYAKAALELGEFYHDGHFVTKSITTAISWYSVAADNGNDEAMNRLGDIYYEEMIEGKDIRTGIEFYALSASQGNLQALTQLITIAVTTNYIKRNPVLLLSWVLIYEKILNSKTENEELDEKSPVDQLGIMVYSESLNVLKKTLDPIFITLSQKQVDEALRIASQWKTGSLVWVKTSTFT